MVFLSAKAPATTPMKKKRGIKAAKAKIKLRKSTPAPICKRNGRKRPDISPFPEHKKLRKKIDFGEEGGSAPRGLEARSLGKAFEAADVSNMANEERSLVCFNPNMAESDSPEAMAAAGEEGVADHGLDQALMHSRSKSKADVLGNSNKRLGGDFVNFPDLECETKPLLESGLEVYQGGLSHVGLAVEGYSQTKTANILLLAQPDSVAMLDSAAAQPLLAGGQPEHPPAHHARAKDPFGTPSSAHRARAKDPFGLWLARAAPRCSRPNRLELIDGYRARFRA